MAVSENDLIVGPLVPARGVTTISLDFYFEKASWLEVYKSGSETPLVLDTDYTVSGEGTSSGVVTLTTPANGTDSYSVYLVVPLQRSSDLQLRGEFRSEPLNIEMDRLWQALQGVDTRLRRTLSVSRTSAPPAPLFSETPATRAGKALVFSSDGTGLDIGDADIGFQNRIFDDISAFRANTTLSHAAVSEGDYIRIGSNLYEVTADGAGDGHYSNVSALVEVYEAGPSFSSRARAVAWIARGGTAADGTVISWPGASVVAETGATVLNDMAGWVPALPLRLGAWADNTTPGTTDMTSALQAAIEYADSLHSTLGSSVPIDLGGVSVGISDQGFYGIDVRGVTGVRLQNGELKAIGTWRGTTPLVRAGNNGSRTDWFSMNNVYLECDHKSAGLLMDNTGTITCVDVIALHFVGYGFRTVAKATELRLTRCVAKQYLWNETGFDNQANRTAIGFDMNTADFVMIDCVSNYCAIPFYKGTRGINWQVIGCHFYNGSLKTVTDADAIYVCKIDGPDGGQITNLYSDRGILYINCDTLDSGGGGRIYIDGVVVAGGGQNTKDIILYTEAVNNNLGGLSLQNVKLPVRATNFDFQTGGSGSYAPHLAWSLINVTQEDGTIATGGVDMFNMNRHLVADGSGNFTFGNFQDVTIRSRKNLTFMADYDGNSLRSDSIIEFGTDGTVYTQQRDNGTWHFGHAQATGGGSVAQVGFTGNNFWVAPTNVSGGFDYSKSFRFDQSAGVWGSRTPFKVLTTTVSGLPSASTAGAGSRAVVTDATATTFASTVSGGGANTVPVFSDGTNWVIG